MVRAYPMITASRTSAVIFPAWLVVSVVVGGGQSVAIGSPRTRYAPTRVSRRTTPPAGVAPSSTRRLICWIHPSWAERTTSAVRPATDGGDTGSPTRTGISSTIRRLSPVIRSMIRPTYCWRVRRLR
jgi:hypothetical protein